MAKKQFRKTEKGTKQPLCFPPVCSGSDSVLILGSFPGQMSLQKNEYYGHPRNSFWKIVGRLLEFDPHIPYQQRIEKLKANGIALWDVLNSCARNGSLDSSIEKESVVINDFESFSDANPLIQTVFFNGSRAENEFKKHVLTTPRILSKSLSLHRLPSTSPAMAMLTLDQKIKAWSIIKDLLK